MTEHKVNKLICGIRYNRSFSVLDDWGKIIDMILYKPNEYFTTDYFTQIAGDRSAYSCSIINPEKGHSFQLTADNLIYTHVLDTENKSFAEEFERFTNCVNKFLIPKIIDKFQLITRRIGIVYYCEMTPESISEFKERYFKIDIDEISDFRFSKREASPSGLAFYGKDDYINKILTVGTIEGRPNSVTYDYQLYFNPPRPEITGKANAIFYKSNEEYLRDVFREDTDDKR